MSETKPVVELCGNQLPNGHRCKLNANHMHACSMWRAEIVRPAETKPHISKCMEMCQEGTCADCDREFAGALRIDAPCPGQCGGSAATDDGPCARCKPTPQPAPAKAIRCIGVAAISTHECRGPNLVRMVGAIRGVMCERWMMTLEAKASDWTPNSGLAPYAGPERLSKPPMAHSYGVECPALEDA